MSDPTGILVVDKPGGMTSHDVVSRARRALGTRKVGHAGTLDPMATGVLVLGVGRATKLLGQLTLTTKAYDARARFGVATTTDDAEGEPLGDPADVSGLTGDAVRHALGAMVGELDQVPSAVSAVKVDGKRAYARVRDGETVVLPPRRVRIDALDVTDVDLPEVALTVRCSSGTYVRAIARDAGAALGVGGHLVALRRTEVGPFTLDDAAALDDVTADRLLTMEETVARCFPVVRLDPEGVTDVRHGRAIARTWADDGPVAVLDDASGEFLALYAGRDDGTARAVTVFAPA
ncbi:tRNA pseudouridine(55) synthase TruB [uncultured Nocardioides sp.]|uniref:tRNA pseudouridine(55) synthase TruB n=1 Tax=uncultured Nocardioides sp. TaxID=198441 RepID=UPI00261A8C24|nr:tRNA pseudouridine(55) synthase TruB [uncultured Nocardioides sp.]